MIRRLACRRLLRLGSMKRNRHAVILTFIMVATIERIFQFQYLRYNKNQRIVSITTTTKFDPTISLWMDSSLRIHRNTTNDNERQSSSSSSSKNNVSQYIRIREPSYQKMPSENNYEKYMKQTNAIMEYQQKVKTANTRALQCTQQQQQQHTIDLSWVQECFQITTKATKSPSTPTPTLEYPIDADRHFNEIRLAVSQYAQHANHKMHTAKQYTGPWIENAYITYYESLYDNNNQLCLSDVFGPFIPIFIPWVDHLVVPSNSQQQQQRHQYPEGLVRTLLTILRPNVPYITISQNDEGIVGKYELNSTSSVPNLLVLSAGGYGHVPIPLLKQEEPYITDRIPIMDRMYDVSYVGSLKNAPYGMRRKMHESMMRYNSTTGTSMEHDPNHHHFRYEYYYGPEWRRIVQNSKFSLVPRGFGRSAYHLMEVLQMGYIPIYVYLTNDTPWIPYLEMYMNEIGYMTDVEHLQDLLSYLHQNASIAELQYREERIAALRATHFTMNAVVMNQIHRFMTGQTKKTTQNNGNYTDLQCQQVPSTLTGKGMNMYDSTIPSRVLDKRSVD